MPTINRIELSQELVDELQCCLEERDQEEIRGFARMYPDHFSGTRQGNVDSIKKRIVSTMLTGRGAVPDELLDFLVTFDFNQFIGKERFLLGLLRDEREEVREFASHIMNGGWRVEFDQEGGLEEGQILRRDLREQEQRYDELKNELQQSRNDEKSARKKIDQLNTKNKTLESESNQLKQELESGKREISKTNEDLCREKKEHLGLQKEIEEKIQAGVDDKFQKAMQTWLARPAALDETAKQTPGDLLDRVEDTLARQAREDRHFGNLRILQERLAALAQAMEKILLARQEALNPLPELLLLSAELEKKYLSLQKKLNLKLPEDHLLKSLQARINEADSFSRLQQVNRLLFELEAAKVLTEEKLKQLYALYRQSFQREMTKYENVQPADHEPQTPISILVEGMRGRVKINLLIDGHNVVLGRAANFLISNQDREFSEADKRVFLSNKIVAAFSDKPKITVRIYFDSPEYSNKNLTQNINQIFSGGGYQKQRADDVIVSDLQNLRRRPSNDTYVLVTDDCELANRSARLNVENLSVIDFIFSSGIAD